MRIHLTHLAVVAFIAAASAVPAHAAELPSANAASHTASTHFKGEKLAAHAKIGIAEARTIALKASPGKITDEELEAENGGSGFRYSFDIKVGNQTREIGVDAVTGKVLENSEEGPNAD